MQFNIVYCYGNVSKLQIYWEILSIVFYIKETFFVSKITEVLLKKVQPQI